MMTPLLLAPYTRKLVWGEERWVVSARPGASSVVVGGEYAGWTLDRVVEKEGVSLTGVRSPNPRELPLLMKIIDARRPLSLQVHPDSASANTLGGDAKNEAWYVLSADSNGSAAKEELSACILAGLKDGVTEESLRSAIADGTAGDAAVRRPVKPGDIYYIPGGTVHAIGGGTRIFEVQQTGETTYRLFDWNRKDANGEMRPLHVEKALKAINWNEQGGKLFRKRVGTPFFTMYEQELDGKFTRTMDGVSFRTLFVVDGVLEVTSGGETVAATSGVGVVVPADTDEFTLKGRAKIISVTL